MIQREQWSLQGKGGGVVPGSFPSHRAIVLLVPEKRRCLTTFTTTMEELTDLKGYLKASNADGTAIFEATTDWCPNCKAIAPYIEKLVKKYPDARFYIYNTDKALDISQELSAHQMPTFHVFKDGELRDSVTGAKAAEIERAIADNYDGKKVEE